MTRRLRLPDEPASVAAARVMVAEELAEADEAERDAAVLLTSELVTNVVRHTDSEIWLSADPGPPIRVEVHDSAAATDAFRERFDHPPVTVTAASLDGRGLVILHRLQAK